MDTDNVTLRPPIRRTTSLHELSNTTIFDSTMLSVPDTSLNINRSCCEDLHHRVQLLTKNLETATNEIDNLNEEIINLKNDLRKCMKVIEVYKKLDYSDLSVTQSNRKKKRLSIHDKNRKSLTTSSPTQQFEPSPLADRCDSVIPVTESPVAQNESVDHYMTEKVTLTLKHYYITRECRKVYPINRRTINKHSRKTTLHTRKRLLF